MDGSILTAVVRLCTRCRRVTWQPSGLCRLCQKGARTSA